MARLGRRVGAEPATADAGCRRRSTGSGSRSSADRAAGLVRRHRPALDREAGRPRHRRATTTSGPRTTWLAGGDPWAVTDGRRHHLRGRPAHAALLRPDERPAAARSRRGVWMVVGLVASIWLVRRLELPLVVARLPAVAPAIWNGNPQTIALALLVLGGLLAAAVAVLIKLYAAVPLLARPRHRWSSPGSRSSLIAAAILPWQLYLERRLGHRRPPRDGMERQRLARARSCSCPDAPRAVDPAPRGRRVVRGPGGLAGDPVLLRRRWRCPRSSAGRSWPRSSPCPCRAR